MLLWGTHLVHCDKAVGPVRLWHEKVKLNTDARRCVMLGLSRSLRAVLDVEGVYVVIPGGPKRQILGEEIVE